MSLEIKVTIIRQEENQAAPANEVKEFTTYAEAAEFFAGRVEKEPEAGEQPSEVSSDQPEAEKEATAGSDDASGGQTEAVSTSNA